MWTVLTVFILSPLSLYALINARAGSNTVHVDNLLGLGVLDCIGELSSFPDVSQRSKRLEIDK